MGNKVAAALTLGCIALLACSSDSESDGPLEPAAFASALAAAYCKAAVSCCTAVKGTIAADCETKVSGDLKTKLDQALANPNLRYDAALAASCVDEYRALPASCEESFASPNIVSCARVVDGVKPAAAACEDVAECATPSGKGYAGCGSADGGPNKQCRQFRYLSSGDACSPLDNPFAGDPATVVGDCGSSDGLYCTDGKCAAGPSAGQPCPDSRCGADASCDFASKACVAVTAKEGEACVGSCAERSLQCINGLCERRELLLPCAGSVCPQVEVCTR